MPHAMRELLSSDAGPSDIAGLLAEEDEQDAELNVREISAGRSQDEELRQQRGFNLRVAGKAALVFAGLGTVALAGVTFGRPTENPEFSSGNSLWSLESAMAYEVLQGESQCADTPGWANGHYQCNSNGYTGPGCIANGFTCEAYAANGWCADGAPVLGKQWAMGEGLNFPELNCCVCGGGSGQIGDNTASPSAPAGSVAAPLAAAPLVEVPLVVAKPAKPASCQAYKSCANLEGSCCPNNEGVSLACCDSEMVCFDEPAWTNGYVKCKTYGVSEEKGCTSGGLTCQGYADEGFCADGAVKEGKEWTLGGRFNHPELNCCACGKSRSGSIANGDF